MPDLSLATFYKGWDVYQQHLVTAVAPLSPEQLAIQVAPHLWSIGMIATHVVATRVGWFHFWMGEGSSDLDPLASWDEDGQPSRSAAELVAGLEATWDMIGNALARWSPADLERVFEFPYPGTDDAGERPTHSRQWIVWHLLEHDLHHGGELSLALGAHGLAGLDL
jgi:uncharacterized damage-inducible protein DinB